MKAKTVDKISPSTATPAGQERGEGASFFQMQRQAEETEREPEEVQAFFQPGAVQAKMTVGAADDPMDREADARADRVVNRQPAGEETCAACGPEEKEKAHRMPEEKEEEAQRAVDDKEEEEPLQMRFLQRMPEEQKEEEPVQAKLWRREGEEEEETLQAKAERVPMVTTPIETRIEQAKGGGQPLPAQVRAQMEEGLGGDFSSVRVHTGAEGAALSAGLNAQAFTVGKDIFFNKGKFDPGSREGTHLLAHELTHTQQQGAVARRKPNVQRADGDMADLIAQIRESATARREAIDPQPAEQARQEAAKEAAAAQQEAANDVPTPAPPEVIAAPEVQPAEVTAQPASKAPDHVPPAIPSEENPPGEAGKQLAADSANACQEAANEAQTLANNEQAHDTPNTLVDQSEAAVEPPAEEGQSRANAEQVDTVNAAETPQTDPVAAKSELDEAIANAVPQSIEAMNDFASEGKAQVVGNKVLEETARQTGEVEGTYAEIEAAPTAAPPTAPTPLPAQPAAPVTPTLNLGEGAVPELAEEQTNFDNFKEDADKNWEREGVTPDLQAEIEQVDSGPLGEANAANTELKDKVEKQPAEAQEMAKTEQQKVKTDMQQEEGQARREMDEKREQELTGAAEEQTKTKSAIELRREEVTTWINDRYETAKTVVDEKLSKLEEQAMTAFDQGQKSLSIAFERNVNQRVDAWKSDRYSGLFGGVKWLKDMVWGIDHFPEVKNIFSTERENFVSGVDRLIATINQETGLVIEACKQEVQQAQTDIEEYVAKLAPDLQDVGQKALEETTAKLEALDKQVDEKKEALQKALCDKREAAIAAIDAKIEEMKSAMSGLVSLIGNLLLLAAKKFFSWVLEKAGVDPAQLMAIIDKGATVLKAIFTDPIGFFVNIGRAVGGGINNFVTNIVEWLKKGLISWLTGAMGDSGLELPEKFDLKGILFMGLQVAGLTWNVIRARLVKSLGPTGEAMVSAAETGVEIISRVIKEGPMALWNIIVEKAEEIKETVMEGIRSWAITKIIQKATVKLLSMLNPAGAIIQAIMLLYDTVMFFVENWQRIIDFVGAIFDSIGNIARGAIGAAAGFIEKALGLTIPMIISFLARFIGLDGIGKAIRNVIKKIQKPFDNILDNIIKFLVKQVKKIFGKGKKGEDKKAQEDDPDNKNGATEIKLDFKMKNKSHDLTLIAGSSANVKMASVKNEPISTKVDAAVQKLKPEEKDKKVKERIKRLSAIKSQADRVEKDLKKNKDGLLDKKQQADMKSKGTALVGLISQYATDFGIDDIAGIFEEYPGPKVDTYGKLSGSEGPIFDGTTREAHHAPPAQMGKSMAAGLKEAATQLVVDYDDPHDYNSAMDILSDFDEDSNPLEQGLAFLALAYSSNDWFNGLEEAAAKLDELGEDGLPAILVHMQTHRVKGAGPRIHGSEIKAALEKNLLAAGHDPKKMLVTKTTKKLSVKPGGKAYDLYLRDVTAEITGNSKKDFKKALADSAKTVVPAIYSRLAVQNFEQVQIALDGSKIDGTPEEKKAAIAKLKTMANTIWVNEVIAKLF